jgi:hypothetical protein
MVKALKVIEKNKHLNKLVRASKENGASVSIDADTVNFVKDFVVKHKMHSHPVGRHIVNAAAPAGITRRGNPAQCNFGKNG